MMQEMTDLFEKLFRVMFYMCVVFVPLGLWKLFELVWRIVKWE